MDWDRLENGGLLAAAESAGFEVMVTCDRNLRYQQNLSGRKLAIVELLGRYHPALCTSGGGR